MHKKIAYIHQLIIDILVFDVTVFTVNIPPVQLALFYFNVILSVKQKPANSSNAVIKIRIK